jgi:hypothetical protein
MGDVLKQRTYVCKCGATTKEIIWESLLSKTKVECSECSAVLTNKNLLVASKTEAVSIRTPTKNR